MKTVDKVFAGIGLLWAIVAIGLLAFIPATTSGPVSYSCGSAIEVLKHVNSVRICK